MITDNNKDLQDFYNSVDNPFDTPVTENGLWEYPNQEVIVPTNGNITMKGVDYPVTGVSMETGEKKFMLPNKEYFFENTSNVYEIPTYQKGGKKEVDYIQLPYNVNDIKSFYNKMINSPWYKERLAKNGYNTGKGDFAITPEAVAEKRAKSIRDASVMDYEQATALYDQEKQPNGKYDVITETMSEFGSFYNPPDKTVYFENVAQPNDLQAHPRTILTHELGHAELDGFPLSTKDRALLKGRLINTENAHEQDPSEKKADINTVRYNLYRKGLFNPETGEYKTKDGKFNKTLFEKIKDDFGAKRLRRNYGDDNAEFILNTIARNENYNDNLFYAQKGGTVDKENVKNFYDDMLNAPWYKERLNNNGYMDSDLVINKRLKNIDRTDFKVDNKVKTGYSQYKKLPQFLSNPHITLNVNESDFLNTPYNDVISHEYGHGETKGSDLSEFEKSLIEDSYISDSDDKQINYLKNPYETKSDINAIRYHLYNMGKYNPKTGEYDTKSKLFEPSLLDNELENTIIKRMKDAYGDDNLKKLMNTVADTNLKDKGYNA